LIGGIEENAMRGGFWAYMQAFSSIYGGLLPVDGSDQLFQFPFADAIRYEWCRSRGWQVATMTRQNERKWREWHRRAIAASDPGEMLDMLLALDRMVVELSLRVYKVSRRERSLMREQNRRLHRAVRKHLPRLLETSPDVP
jgi:hypothetical protein